MDLDPLKQEIDALITLLGDDVNIARPAAEREVVEKIRAILESTRDQRTGAMREIWETYLPYAAQRCYRLTRLEEGWEDELEYFASENAQYWLDNAAALLDAGDIARTRSALGNIREAARMIRRDRIAQVELLLQALDIAVEISDKKRALQFYGEAEKLHRKHLAGGSEFTGSAWLPKIKKMGQQLAQYREKLRRYYQYAETVTVSIEADGEGDLERVIDYLQQSLPGRVTVTRKVKDEDANAQHHPRSGRFRARVKFTLEDE